MIVFDNVTANKLSAVGGLNCRSAVWSPLLELLHQSMDMSEYSSSSRVPSSSTNNLMESGQDHKLDCIERNEKNELHEDDYEKKIATESRFMESKENLENYNNKSQRGLKRSYSKSNIASGTLSNRAPIKQSATSPRQNPFINNVLSPNRSNIINVQRVTNANDNDETKNFEMEYSKSLKCEKEQSSQNVANVSSIKPENKDNVDLVTEHSPLTTCGPHPSLHKQSQPITRYTTFDDDNARNENDSSDASSEKECFVSNNLSFCESCKDGSSRDECFSFNCQENDGGFSKLFDENILSIFQWLPKKTLMRCMLVCKRWHRLALDSRLWSRVCLGGKVLPSGVIPNLMSRHPIILRLANSQLVAPVIPSDIIPSPWRVQYLDMSAASVSPSCLAKILVLCPALLRLSLEGLALSEAASIALGNLTQLKVLNLVLTTGLGKEGANSISKLTNLEALNIGWTGLDMEAMDILCDGLPSSVQRLNLSGFRKTLTEDMVITVITRCPQITELDLSDCILLGDRLIPALSKLTRLEHLSLSRCSKFTISSIVTLNNMPSLQWLDIFGMMSTNYDYGCLQTLSQKIQLNRFYHSAIARPTVGNRRTSIWGLRTRD